jgi:hypothetical protein
MSAAYLMLIIGPALGQTDSSNPGPAAEGADSASNLDPPAEEEKPFIDVDIDTNFGDETPFIDIDINMSRLLFPSRDSSRKRQAEEGEEAKRPKPEERWNDFLPLFRKQAVEKGYELPFPMGISSSLMIIDQDIQVSDLRVGLSGSSPKSIRILSESEVDANSKSANMRFDAWVLPFLNVYGLIGYTWATSDIVLTAEIDPPLTPPEIVEIPIEAKVDGPTWGLGGSLVGGYSHFFGMVDVNYTWTDISAFDDYITKLVASARVGIQGKVWRMSGALWVGTMYLNNEATIQITLPSNLPAPALNGALIEIDQKSEDHFNFIFGGAWNITRHFQLTVEGGVGERDQFLVSLGTRF